MSKPIYIHEIKLNGESDFAKKFNRISEAYARSQDETLTQEERDAAWEEHFKLKLALEMGY